MHVTHPSSREDGLLKLDTGVSSSADQDPFISSELPILTILITIVCLISAAGILVTKSFYAFFFLTVFIFSAATALILLGVLYSMSKLIYRLITRRSDFIQKK